MVFGQTNLWTLDTTLSALPVHEELHSCYSCTEPDCTRRYDSLGYFDSTVGYRIKRAVEQRRCPKDGSAMYLSEFRTDGTCVWRCQHESCDFSETIAPEVT
jgi:hypothetical protein